eukprot:1024942-Pyramimonas_sp.AAC.1
MTLLGMVGGSCSRQARDHGRGYATHTTEGGGISRSRGSSRHTGARSVAVRETVAQIADSRTLRAWVRHRVSRRCERSLLPLPAALRAAWARTSPRSAAYPHRAVEPPGDGPGAALRPPTAPRGSCRFRRASPRGRGSPCPRPTTRPAYRTPPRADPGCSRRAQGGTWEGGVGRQPGEQLGFSPRRW